MKWMSTVSGKSVDGMVSASGLSKEPKNIPSYEESRVST